ncbi:hypothetical protein [Shewanella marina]|nr:hypothetical protein [Shewanella marina]
MPVNISRAAAALGRLGGKATAKKRKAKAKRAKNLKRKGRQATQKSLF